MKVLVGLGNYGTSYRGTRHNAGYKLVDKTLGLIDGQWDQNSKFNSEIYLYQDVVLARPLTFMNSSGDAVSKIINYYKAKMNDLWIAHDDLDIVLGEYKIQKGVGPKVHNGVASVERSLGTSDFWRIRIGTDTRNGNRSITGEDFVLAKFRKNELELLDDVLKSAVSDIKGLIGF
jgi:PTH1 family peptidyl-tRNA hydrolase